MSSKQRPCILPITVLMFFSPWVVRAQPSPAAGALVFRHQAGVTLVVVQEFIRWNACQFCGIGAPPLAKS